MKEMEAGKENVNNEDERPFIMVNGQRYVLDTGQENKELDLRSLPANPRLAQIPPPPRTISLAAKLLLYFESTNGSTFGKFWLCGVLLFVFGFFAVGSIGPRFIERCAHWESFATAKLVSCDEAKIKINGKAPRIWCFEGKAPNGSSFNGKSYSFRHIEPGQSVKIERMVGSKDILRAEGTSVSLFCIPLTMTAIVCIFLGVFVLIGASLGLLAPIRYGLRAVPLLQYGQATQAVQEDISETGVTINHIPEQCVIYRFLADDGLEYRTKVKTLDIEKLTDEETEIVFYNSENPEKAIVLDELPCGIKHLQDGSFGTNPFRLFIPLIFLAIILCELVVIVAVSMKIERATFSDAATPAVSAVENDFGPRTK